MTIHSYFDNAPMVDALKPRLKQNRVTVTIEGSNLRSPAR